MIKYCEILSSKNIYIFFHYCNLFSLIAFLLCFSLERDRKFRDLSLSVWSTFSSFNKQTTKITNTNERLNWSNTVNVHVLLLLLPTLSVYLILSNPSSLQSNPPRLHLPAHIPLLPSNWSLVRKRERSWSRALAREAAQRSRAVVPAYWPQVADAWKANILELTLVLLTVIVAAKPSNFHSCINMYD